MLSLIIGAAAAAGAASASKASHSSEVPSPLGDVSASVFAASDEPEWSKGVPWRMCYMLFVVALELFELVLNLRQLRRLRDDTIPPQLKNIITVEELRKNNLYGADKMKFSIFSSLFHLILWFFTMVYFLQPMIWRWAGRLVGEENEYFQSLCYLAIYGLIQNVVGTPFSLYYDFVLEERHGFNKKTLSLFFVDKLTGLAVTIAIGSPTICLVIWLVKWGGPNFYLWLEGFAVIMVLVMMFVYPNFIAPLFNKFEVLKDEELRIKIEKLAASLKFPLTKLYQIDGSKRSSHSNAYFYGLWRSKRIVLYDTLLHLPHERILAILGHELGHWKLRHTRTMMLSSFFQLFVIFFLFGKVRDASSLYASFGFQDTRATIIGLMLFMEVFSPVNTLLGLAMTLLSRKNEFEADEFSSGLGYNADLQQGLIDIHKENRACLDPDPWYSWWHYSHPSLIERLRALHRLAAIDRGKEKKAE